MWPFESRASCRAGIASAVMVATVLLPAPAPAHSAPVPPGTVVRVDPLPQEL